MPTTPASEPALPSGGARQPTQLQADERGARELALVQALEAGDPPFSEVEVLDAERRVLEARGVRPGERPDATWYLPARAHALLTLAVQRDRRLAALATPQAGWARAAGVLAVAALLLGFFSDRIGNPRELDLLSLPLLAFVAWNFAVYAALAVSAVLRAGGQRRRDPVDRLLRAVSGFVDRLALRAPLRHAAWVARFREHWWRVAGHLDGVRLQAALHAAAAAWAIGLVLSIAWVGIGREFRVGWESTWLSAGQVQAVVNVLAEPGRLLLGQPPFSLADIERLHFRSALSRDASDGRRWAVLYIVFLLVAVVLPRVLLAFGAAWVARRRAGALSIDLRDPYWEGVMARVSPVTIVLVLRDAAPHWRDVLDCALRQAGATGDPPELRSAQGDRLRLATEGDGDVVVTVAEQGATPDLGACAIVLCAPEADAAAVRQAVAARGARCEVLQAARVLGCFAQEGPLRDALVRQLPQWQQRGAERLVAAWDQEHRRRWQDTLREVTDLLADTARDTEEVDSRFSPAARRAARERLLGRLKARTAALHAELLRTWGVTAQPAHEASPGPAGVLDDFLTAGGAGAAGALAGAGAGVLAGAHVDVLTGGLTLGLGAAVGAVLGGLGAFGAANWLDFGRQVRLGDAQLAAVLQGCLLQVLVVIHAGRVVVVGEGEGPPAWAAHCADALREQEEDWQKAWPRLHAAPGREQARTVLHPPVQAYGDAVLRRLRPPSA